jgi:hypothetical protein
VRYQIKSAKKRFATAVVSCQLLVALCAKDQGTERLYVLKRIFHFIQTLIRVFFFGVR